MLRLRPPRPCLRVAVLAAVSCTLALFPAAASAGYTFDVASGNATVTGDAAGDTLAIGVEHITSTVAVLEHDRAGKDRGLASAIDWDSSASGTQTVRNSSSPTVTISAGGGGDVVALGGTTERASDLAVGFSIDMGSNAITQPDVLGFVNRLGPAHAATVGRDGLGAFVTGFGAGVRHAGAERLSVVGSPGNDSVLVQRLAERLNVSGGFGIDTTTFEASTTTAVTGPISVSDVAQTGVVNKLVANGAAAAAELTMTLRPDSVAAGGTTASFNAAVTAELRSGTGGDVVFVEGTSATARPFVTTGGGADLVRAGAAGSLDGIEDLDLDMGSGSDRFELNDSQDPGASDDDVYNAGINGLRRNFESRQQDVAFIGSFAGGGVNVLDIAASQAGSFVRLDTPGAAFITHAALGGGGDAISWTPSSRVGTISGGEGRDLLDLFRFSAGVTADLRSTTIAGAASVSGFEDLSGGNGPDNLTGLAAAPGSVIRGFGGADTIAGGEGDDVLLAGPGDDGVTGAGGADRLEIDSDGTDGEKDRFDAGFGLDTLAVRGSGVADQLVARPSLDAERPLQIANVSGDLSADTGAVDVARLERVEIATLGGPDHFGVTEEAATEPVGYDVDGGDGDDDLLGGGADDELSGGDGVDDLEGGGGNDVLAGGDEADQLRGGPGSDIATGGTGQDLFHWSARDGAAADAIDGGPEHDGLVFSGSDARDLISVQPGSGLHEIEIHGSAGSPTMQGLDLLETASFRLGRGDDELVSSHNAGAAFNFLAAGDSGDDTLVSGAMSDSLQGGEGDDTLRGGGGDDLLDGREGADVMSGGAGVDRVDYRHNEGSTGVTVDQDNVPDDGNATDTADAGAGTARDDVRSDVEVLFGSTLGDSLTGGPADNVLVGETGPDDLRGGGGVDTVEYSQAFGPVTVDIDGVADDGEAADEAGGRRDNVALDVENLRGGPGTDTLSGDAGANVLDGAGDADAMFGRGGVDTVTYASRSGAVNADLDGEADDGLVAGEGVNQDRIGADVENLVGGSGPDVLRGDGRSNVLEGGGSFDHFHGGGGIDTVTYRGRTTPVTADLDGVADDGGVEEGAGRDLIGVDVENLTGGNAADILSGDGRANVLDGGPGADDLIGGGGTDTVTYAARTAGVTVSIGAGANDGSFTDAGTGGRRDDVRGDVENLTGGSGADTLAGSDAANLFKGGSGPDVFQGLGGVDTVSYAERTQGVVADIDGAADDGSARDERIDEDQGAIRDLVSPDIENLIGGTGADWLTGDADANRITSRDGVRDDVFCLGGADTVVADSLDVFETPGCETVLRP